MIYLKQTNGKPIAINPIAVEFATEAEDGSTTVWPLSSDPNTRPWNLDCTLDYFVDTWRDSTGVSVTDS